MFREQVWGQKEREEKTKVRHDLHHRGQLTQSSSLARHLVHPSLSGTVMLSEGSSWCSVPLLLRLLLSTGWAADRAPELQATSSCPCSARAPLWTPAHFHSCCILAVICRYLCCLRKLLAFISLRGVGSSSPGVILTYRCPNLFHQRGTVITSNFAVQSSYQILEYKDGQEEFHLVSEQVGVKRRLRHLRMR